MESAVHRMIKIKSKKKRAAVKVLIGLLALYCMYSVIVLVRAANCQIFIEPVIYTRYSDEESGVEPVEVLSLKEKTMILKLYDRRYITTYRGDGSPLCAYSGMVITYVKNGETTSFNPRLHCPLVFYEGEHYYIFRLEAYRLEKLLQRYFPEESNQ